MNMKDVLKEYYDLDNDNINIADMKDDERKPRFTLKHINKLRKVRNMREVEKEMHKKVVSNMYGAGQAGEDDAPDF